jgi:hypothetical protein
LSAESVTDTLASKEELAAGASIAHAGLGMPPRPPPATPLAQLVMPGLEAGPCEFISFSLRLLPFLEFSLFFCCFVFFC